jgi:signal peptidase I
VSLVSILGHWSTRRRRGGGRSDDQSEQGIRGDTPEEPEQGWLTSATTAHFTSPAALPWRFVVLRVPAVASRGRVILATLALATAVVGCGVLSARTYQMDTLDMAPTLPRGTLVSLQSETSIHRGDIVALSPPSFLKLHGVNYLLRRVIGLPGETIRGRDGHIVVNGRRLAEPYLPRGTISPSFQGRRIPAGRYFVLGDNRRTALDSRRFGPVPRSTIVGRVSL